MAWRLWQQFVRISAWRTLPPVSEAYFAPCRAVSGLHFHFSGNCLYGTTSKKSDDQTPTDADYYTEEEDIDGSKLKEELARKNAMNEKKKSAKKKYSDDSSEDSSEYSDSDNEFSEDDSDGPSDLDEIEDSVVVDKWKELKERFDAGIPMDLFDDDKDPKHKNNLRPDENLKYTKKVKESKEAHYEFCRAERERYRRILEGRWTSPRFFSEDKLTERVNAKLASVRPDADGVYRGLVDLISDTDILLDAYRKVKAAKMGPGTDIATIPVDNLNMEWFYKVQKELRDGTYQFKPCKVVLIKKKKQKK